jgi:excisionase family DNA binding protein
MLCPVCYLSSEMLTVQQAGALVQVKPESIRRWLAQGKAHGVKTPGGHYRICKNSLFHSAANLESLMYLNGEDHD